MYSTLKQELNKLKMLSGLLIEGFNAQSLSIILPPIESQPSNLSQTKADSAARFYKGSEVCRLYSI